MSDRKIERFRIGAWLVDPTLGVIEQADERVSLRPREMDLLAYLATTKGELVSADDIIRNVWSGGNVANDSIYFAMSQLRKALGDDSSSPRYIQTVPKRGYRLLAPVEVLEGHEPKAPTLTGPERGGEVHSRSAHREDSAHSWYVWSLVVLGVAALAVLFSSFRFDADPVVPTTFPPMEEKSIAVMPFVDLSPDGDQEYFSDGMAEEIINNLSTLPGLLVAARTSSFSYKGREPAVQEIGDALGVRTILEGSVRKEGDRVRIAAQLIDTENGFQLWNETYDRELSGVLAIQDDISRAIVSALKVELGSRPAPMSTLLGRVVDQRAYDHYLRGLQAFRISSFDSLRRAVRHYEEALLIDPSFAQVHNELARTKINLWLTGATKNIGLLDEAKRHAERSLELNAEDGSAYRSLGMVAYEQGRLSEGFQLLERARSLSPNDPQTLVELANIAYMAGQKNEAQAWFLEAIRHDPLNPKGYQKQCLFLRDMGRTEDAIASMQMGVDQNPGNPSLRGSLGYVIMMETGDVAEGVRHLMHSSALDPEDPESQLFPALGYLSLGAADLAVPLIDRALALDAERPFAIVTQGVRFALGGELDEAAKLLIENQERMRTPLTFNPQTLAMFVVLKHVLDRGDLQAAEEYLLSDRFGIQRLINQPPYDAYGDFYAQKVPADWLVLLAHVYKKMGRIDSYNTVMEKLEIARLPSMEQFRWELRNVDYVLEAQALAVEGDEEGALSALELAIQRGFRLNWQLYLLMNPVFTELRGHPRFESLVQTIEEDMANQLASL